MTKIKPIRASELWGVQAALLAAILLQLISWFFSPSLHFGPQYLIFISEVALVFIIGITARERHNGTNTIHKTLSIVLLAVLSAANISSLFLVLFALIDPNASVNGYELLASGVAIFLTNIIVFGLWYWEIDSPGLTGKSWSSHDKDFQFTQHDLATEYLDWQPTFFDYLYLSVTNAVNFAPADARPLTLQAKALMGTQALVSVFTLALLIARSISILS